MKKRGIIIPLVLSIIILLSIFAIADESSGSGSSSGGLVNNNTNYTEGSSSGNSTIPSSGGGGSGGSASNSSGGGSGGSDSTGAPRSGDEPGKIYDEVITCVFKNTDAKQQCYIASETGSYGCSGIGKCAVSVGTVYQKITWKSSCGGYGYTTTDGNDETVEFECKSGQTSSEEVNDKGYKAAYWKCYDGKEQKSEEVASCRRYDAWQKMAYEFCKDKCDGDKCGVNVISIGGECYPDKATTAIPPTVVKGEEEKKLEIPKESLICENSCPLDSKCYPFGYRKDSQYCTDNGTFEKQTESGAKCENNFECSSNVCISNQCVSQGLLEKIINWFKRLFKSE